MKVKELGTIAVGMFVILAMGMGDAPKPEAVQAFAVIEEVKGEPVKENTVKEKELTVQDQIVLECEEAGVNPEIAVAIARVISIHAAHAGCDGKSRESLVKFTILSLNLLYYLFTLCSL